MAIKAKNPGIYATFVAQMDKAARHNRQGSFRTKEQYYEAENGSAGSWPTTTTCKSWPTSAANTEDFTAITIKGKGGKVRTVPINESIRAELRKLLAVTPRGHKLFVPDDVPTHRGLRHSYAARTWQELIDCGVPPLRASLRVSQLLGHEQADVTNIYLAFLREEF